jgi:hypothetical protein
MRIPQHVDQIGIYVLDLAGNRVKQQDAVLRGFKYPAISGLGNAQSAISGCRRKVDDFGGHVEAAVPFLDRAPPRGANTVRRS